MSLLPVAPPHVEQYNHIAVQYQPNLAYHYNKLSAAERIFIYYMFRASLPGNYILTDQIHRHAQEIKTIFEHIVAHAAILEKIDNLFVNQARIFLVFLATNHGHYFTKEDSHNKRTPAQLDLQAITAEKLMWALTHINYPNAQERVKALEKTLFDPDYEPTLTFANSIDLSAVNLYAPDVTDADYAALDPALKALLNAYCYKTESGKVTMQLYSTGDRYAQELSVAVYWLKKAQQQAQENPEFFDSYTVSSLENLIGFLETGDELLFKKHSIDWLRTNNKVDYTFGFIETYADPKSARGMFQAEATIKTIDINSLALLLPDIERQLPFPDAYKRETLSTDTVFIPNASINVQAFGTGELGPLKQVAAYCLPNYEDIRATHGSKQIIYHIDRSIGSLLNADLDLKLSYSQPQVAWLKTYDPEHTFVSTLDNIQTILHETIGHASGKLAMHTFVPGDNFVVEQKQYSIGDKLPVTHTNLREFLAGFDHTIEELRAEIIALYVSIFHLDELKSSGLLKDIPSHIADNDIIEWFILVMAYAGLKRFIRQSDNASDISGDHARANNTITNYLLKKEALVLHYTQKTINGTHYTVPCLHITNITRAKEIIKELMIRVQAIKSTGDTIQARYLISAYGIPLWDHKAFHAVKANNKAIVGTIKAIATIYPIYKPVYNQDNILTDIHAYWPATIFEQHDSYIKLALLRK